jgi:hypothetical protein
MSVQTITVIEQPVPADARVHVIMDNYDAPISEVFDAAREFQGLGDEVAYEAEATTVHKIWITEGQTCGYAIKALVSGHDADAAADRAQAQAEEWAWEERTGR